MRRHRSDGRSAVNSTGAGPVLSGTPGARSGGKFLGLLVVGWMLAWMVFDSVSIGAESLVPREPREPGSGIVSSGPMAGIHAAELRWIVPFQRVGNLGRVMEWISDLGPGKPMLVCIALVLCVFDRRLAARLALLVVICLWLRELLALALQSPRPYWIEPMVRTFRNPPLASPTFGLPSGHAMTAAAFWFFVAAEARRPWVWWAAGAIVAAVAISRVYQGLHFISDVMLGILLGAAWAWCFRTAEPRVGRWWESSTPWKRAGLALAVGLAMVAVSVAARWVYGVGNDPEAWRTYGTGARRVSSVVAAGGTVFGMGLAWSSALGWTGSGDPWRLRLGRLAVAALPAGLYFFRPSRLHLSRLLLPSDSTDLLLDGLRFLTAAGAVWCGWWLLPRLFQLCRLTREPAGQ